MPMPKKDGTAVVFMSIQQRDRESVLLANPDVMIPDPADDRFWVYQTGWSDEEVLETINTEVKGTQPKISVAHVKAHRIAIGKRIGLQHQGYKGGKHTKSSTTHRNFRLDVLVRAHNALCDSLGAPNFKVD